MNEWMIAQNGESEWWGNCQNTYFEEEKQLKYARKMGLDRTPNSQTPYVFDINKTVLDIGGGPTSILLKCVNVQGTVIDPLVGRNAPVNIFTRVDFPAPFSPTRQ